MRSRWTPVFVLLALAGCQDKQPGSPPAPAGAIATTLTTTDVVGHVGGRPFFPDRVILEGKTLTFRKGKDFFPDQEIKFDLPEGIGGQFEGREWRWAGDVFENPTVTVSARTGTAQPQTDMVGPKDYTMSLRITKQSPTEIQGVIDLRVTKPAQTLLGGRFTAAVRKTVDDPLGAEDAPYIQGSIVFVGPWTEEKLNVGFLGKGADGKDHSNMVGTRVTTAGSGGSGTSMTFDPQLTSIINRPNKAPGFRHTKLPPGEYVVYVRRNDVLAAWKKVTVKAEDQLTVDLTIDLAQTGEVGVTLPDEEANDSSEWHLSLIPAELNQPNRGYHFAFNAAEVKKGQKSVTVKGVPAGKYKAIRGKSEAEVEVVAGKSTPVTLVRTEPTKK